MNSLSSELAIDGTIASHRARPFATVVLEASRYLAASVAALALDATLLWIGVTGLGWPAWLAGSLAYLVGLVFIYFVSVRWVFARRAVADRRAEFVVFAAIGAFGLALNAFVLAVATSLGVGLPLAKALSAAIGFLTNFVARKLMLFGRTAPTT